MPVKQSSDIRASNPGEAAGVGTGVAVGVCCAIAVSYAGFETFSSLINLLTSSAGDCLSGSCTTDGTGAIVGGCVAMAVGLDVAAGAGLATDVGVTGGIAVTF